MKNKTVGCILFGLALILSCIVVMITFVYVINTREEGSMLDDYYTDSAIGDVIDKVLNRVGIDNKETQEESEDEDDKNTLAGGPTKTPVIEPSSKPTKTPTPKSGYISGTVSYPSEYIPEGIIVCAESDLTVDDSCTDDITASEMSGYTYNLEVPPGSYYVYSFDPESGDGYQAYYTKFVTCGYDISCPSHEHILVEVSAGQTIEGIDPGDWYE